MIVLSSSRASLGKQFPRLLAACVCAFAPVAFVSSACAQETNVTQKMPVSLADKTVSIDAEDATLASVVTTLMQNVDASYTLDSSLRSLRVTAHLHNLRLDIALNVLLRNVTPPITYRVENGVYSFVPKVEPTVPEILGGDDSGPQPSGGGVKHIQVIRLNFLDAAEAAQILGGIPIKTSEGQTYGLVDPAKLTGAVTSPTPSGSGNGGTGTNGKGAGGNVGGGAGGASGTLPANLFDYIWLVNAGAMR